MCNRLLTALLVTPLFGFASTQVPNDLREAMQARHRAVWQADAVTWDRFTAEEFTVVVPDGTLMTKAERLTALKMEKPGPVPTVQQEQIRAYGDTVLRRMLDGDEWVLEMWVKQDGVWRVVAAQVNLAKKRR